MADSKQPGTVLAPIPVERIESAVLWIREQKSRNRAAFVPTRFVWPAKGAPRRFRK
jgi:hypothetical protein